MKKLSLFFSFLIMSISAYADIPFSEFKTEFATLQVPQYWLPYMGHDSIDAGTHNGVKVLRWIRNRVAFEYGGSAIITMFKSANPKIRYNDSDVGNIVQKHIYWQNALTDTLNYDATRKEWWVDMSGFEPCVKKGKLTTQEVCRKAFIRCHDGTITMIEISVDVLNKKKAQAIELLEKVHDSWK